MSIREAIRKAKALKEEIKSIDKNDQEKSFPSGIDAFGSYGHLATGLDALPRKHYIYYVLVAFDLLNRGQAISQGIILQHGPNKDWWSRFKEQYSDVLRWRDNGREEYEGLE